MTGQHGNKTGAKTVKERERASREGRVKEMGKPVSKTTVDYHKVKAHM